MVPIHFAASALLRLLGPTPLQGVAFIVALNVVLFAVLPGLFVYLGRVDLIAGAGMSVRDPVALGIGLAAGLVLGVSLWPIELWLLAQSGLNKMLQERFAAVLENFRQTRESVGWAILLIVIVPAILEEYFFRGLLFNALRRRSGAFVTIAASAGLFALTHVVLDGALGLERLVPSLLLGVILSTVCWFSGGLWPSVVLHVCHNTILMIVGMGGLGANDEVPWEWRIAGAIGTALGLCLLVFLIIRERRSSAKQAA
jgi:ABC-2 type transport system permease protein/sodium transport system permease protein